MADNHITRVAIIGASGRIGGAFARSLLATGKHTVTALTRPSSTGAVPAGANVVQVDYDDEAAMVAALKGQQFLAITLGVRAAPDLHGKIVAAAGKAGVPYIMPNSYGMDSANKRLKTDHPFPLAAEYGKRAEEVTAAGASFISLCCGFWYEWSLALPEPWFGFTIAERKVTFFDEGKTAINVSTWDQCGRALAALLSLPISGASPCVEDWKNKSVYIASFRVSQRDMLDSVHRVLGTTDADWKITFEGSEERYSRGMKELQAGDQMGFARAMYSRIFFPQGDGDYESMHGLANEKLGLPKEDLDEMTKRAVEMAENDFFVKTFGSAGPIKNS